jgi:copper chaperone
MLAFEFEIPLPRIGQDVFMTPTQDIRIYTVPGISCSHCVTAIRDEVGQVAGVDEVDVALDSKRVTVRGRDLDDHAVRAAIAEAGYEAVG